MKLKVALCLSGHFRTFAQTKISFLYNLVERYDPDIFIHTWDNLGYGLNGRPSNKQTIIPDDETDLKIKQNAHLGTSDNAEFIRSSPKLQSSLFEDVFKKIKKIEIEDYDEIEPEILAIASRIDLSWSPYPDYTPTPVSLHRKVYLCNELKKEYEKLNSVKYDVVIRTRPDLFIDNIDLSDYIKEGSGTTKNKVYLSSEGSYHAVSDVIAFGDSESMDKYSSLFSKIDYYIEQKANFNPHDLLQRHLKEEDLSVAVEKCGVRVCRV